MLSPRMKVRPIQWAWAVVIALGAWGCFALFLAYQSGPWSAVPSYVPVVGVVGFLLYLLEIAYLIYLRAGPPPGAIVRVGPGLCWGLTIVAVSGVGITGGFAFNDALRTYYGLLSLETITMAMIAAGMVVTMTGGLWSVPSESRSTPKAPQSAVAASPVAADDREPFWRWGLRGLSFPVGAMLTAAPFMLLMKALRAWVDVPRCHRLCEASGYTFDALLEGKHYRCQCLRPGGTQYTFNAPLDFLGGHSWALTIIEDCGRLVLYMVAFGVAFVCFWLPWVGLWAGPSRGSGKAPKSP
jgi:hypothetical protein